MTTKTKATHTPGPWFVGEDNDIFVDGACIATVCGAPEGITEAVANARLIAAAPELLEAAEQAVSQKGDWLASLQRAIAKATRGDND